MRVQHVATELVVDDGRENGRLTVLELSWWSSDPLAVTMTMISRPDHPALPRGAWVALRDTLRAGLSRPTGDGDVRLEPERPGSTLRLDLSGAGRLSTVSIDAGALRAFLDHADSILPPGAENAEAELDSLLASLLRT